jgi:hypothetical protein
VIVVEVPSVLWIVPKGFDLSKPCYFFFWHANADIIGYRDTECIIAMVVSKEKLISVCDTEFSEGQMESRTTWINEECAGSITENTCVNMSVVDI